MPAVTFDLSERANAYVRRKRPTGRGIGALISEILVAEETREQTRAEAHQALEAHQAALRAAWDESGLENVE